MEDLKVEDIVNRIVDSILQLPIFDRKSLTNCIKVSINIWVKKQNFKRTRIPKIDNLRIAIAKEHEEHLYWRKLCKSLLTEEEMQKHYSILKQKLTESGFKS